MKKPVNQSLKRGIIIFMMMKVLYLFCFINVTASVTSVYSQKTRLSIDIENERLENVLSKIEKETDFFFFYKNEELARLDPVTVKQEESSIYDVMDLLLAESGLTYKIIDEYIAIVPASSEVAGTFQQERISGIVRDTDGLPIPGVTVVVKGKPSTGVTTDVEGRFSISAVAGDILQFSFVGMTPKEITVTDLSFLDIILEESIFELDDVIVVAYGTTKRETFTGSASVVSKDKLANRPLSNFSEALAANSTGVNVYSDGQPGAMPTIRIRGIGSMNASSAPLYVIDGVAVNMSDISQLGNISSNPMTSINPSDIESMTILKDAAAASLYGSRAANGVIIITTKQGTEGKPRFNLDVQRGASTALYNADIADKDEFAEIWVTSELHYLMRQGRPSGADTYEYIKEVYADQAQYDSYLATARSRFNSNYRIEGTIYDFWGDGYDQYPNTNWMDEVSHANTTDKINLSASGGQNGVTYFASGEYYNLESPIKKASLKRYSGRINLTSKAHKKIWFGTNMNYSYTDQSGPQSGLMYANPIRAANQIPSVVPVYNEDGTYNQNFPYNVLSNYNPVQILDNADFSTETYRQLGTAWVQYNITDDLFIKSTLGVDIRQTHESRWYPPGIAAGRSNNGIKYENEGLRRRITSSTIMNYSHTFNEVHNFSALAGWESEETFTRLTSGTVKEYQTAFTPVLSAGSVINSLSGSDYTYAMLSALGKAEYNYNNKYYTAFSFRRDGASHFAEQSRWGNFYSVSGAWRISNEPFLSSLTWLDDAKLRASYGINGTLPSSVFSYIGNYSFGNDYNDQSGAAIRNVENLNLSWERSQNINIGAEARIFEGRVFASLEYFNRYSDELLLDRELSRVSGYTTATVNLGAMRNKGLEFTLNARPVQINDFSWDITLNLTSLTNKIESLPSDDVISLQINREGYTEQSWYMPEWAGINKETGEPQWYHVDDATGEKAITTDIDDATRQIFGNRIPHYAGGFNSVFTYGNFELSMLFSFAWDFNVFDYDGARYLQDDGYSRSLSKESALLDSWRPDNTGSDNPILMSGVKNGSEYSTRYLYKGDYFKMKNIRLNYTLPASMVKFIGVAGLQAFVQAENLFILTQMPNFDPEVSLAAKRYLYEYPTQRTISAGINLSF
jgi:TonB-linked SusC/RagA family outer membrane protein